MSETKTTEQLYNELNSLGMDIYTDTLKKYKEIKECFIQCKKMDNKYHIYKDKNMVVSNKVAVMFDITQEIKKRLNNHIIADMKDISVLINSIAKLPFVILVDDNFLAINYKNG